VFGPLCGRPIAIDVCDRCYSREVSRILFGGFEAPGQERSSGGTETGWSQKGDVSLLQWWRGNSIPSDVMP